VKGAVLTVIAAVAILSGRPPATPVARSARTSGRIDLSPVVCDPLRRFLRSRYTPFLNLQSYQLAEALVTLAHEAEHLRHPEAAEDVVECYALQRVRAIVRDAERRPSYQKEMAGLAWEVGYPNTSDEYRTEDCRNGGPLDLHPRSQAWP
jgi:hypothetical protein